jgi:tetratricopeptide (TPR) repeat protein
MGLFISPTFNLIGSWNEFSIFFGFIALISLSLLELGKFKKNYRVFLFIVLFFSFLAMLSVNYLNSWIIFGSFIFIFLIYLLSDSFLKHNSEGGLDNEGKFVRITFFLFLIILFIILGRNLLNDFNNFLNTTSIEVRPSWSSTYHVVTETLKEKIILGSGPNTFLYDWLKFKPQMVNSTLFWSVRFESGFGILPSFVATAGPLGGILLAVFLVIFFVMNGGKVISNIKRDNTHALLLSSFLGSAYLWVSLIFYSPGIVIITLAFLMTGVSLGMLVKTEKIKILTINIFKNARIGFVSIFLITVLIILFILTSYIFSQKYWAEKLFVQASSSFNSGGDLDKVETDIINATKFNKTDKYFRMLSDVNLIKTQNLLLQKDITVQEVQIQFQNFYGAAIKNARTAADINGPDPLNWMQLGKVYELAVPLGIQDASEMAINSYNEALIRSPIDPSIIVSSARVKLKAGDRVSARNLLSSALELKNDFTPALFMLSQMDVSDGNLKSAIQMAEQAFISSPNDIGVLFQLSMLYYNDRDFDNAQLALEKVVILRPDYSNARYFLGLIYSRKDMALDAIAQFRKIEEYNLDNAEVKRILNNLENGRPALESISPPEKLPEEREKPPIEDR